MSIQSKSIDKEIRERDKSLETEGEKDENLITVSKETVRQAEVQLIVEAWNELQDYGIKPISKLSAGTKRYTSLMARIKQYNAADILAAIDRIKSSEFLQGKNKNGWAITFDWFVLPNNFHKVLEGNYDNKNAADGVATRNSYVDKISNRVNEVDNW